MPTIGLAFPLRGQAGFSSPPRSQSPCTGNWTCTPRALLTRELEEVVAQSAPHPPGVIVDLSELAFCDSSGLSALITVRHQMTAADQPLALARAHDMVERILHRTGLDRVFRCYPTVADAERALAGHTPM
ncbi:STAS domain-containing protein [Nonomuraea dietziae]|uniref:STAS domain-containing protein n=1 Tax=Nonomuraea dietziae TaxID=65515 RepID=UPI0031E21E45